MRTPIDLTGMVFGRLTVIGRHGTVFGKNGTPKVMWLCECSCRKRSQVVVHSTDLKSGNTKSCRCISIEKTIRRNRSVGKDLSGRRFGRLLVFAKGKDYLDSSGKFRSTWICKCDCGNNVSVQARHLQDGLVLSCGCLKESLVAHETKKYLTENYNAIAEYKIVKNPKTGRWLPYDVYIPSGIFVEIHGSQHYCVDGWHHTIAKNRRTSPEEEFERQKYRDELKRKYAQSNGVYIEIDLRKTKSVEDAIKYIERSLKRKNGHNKPNDYRNSVVPGGVVFNGQYP